MRVRAGRRADVEQHVRGSADGDAAAGPEADEPRVSSLAGVVHVEEVVRAVARVEDEREEAEIADGANAAADVEKRTSEDAAVLDHPDSACLLGDIEPIHLSGYRARC